MKSNTDLIHKSVSCIATLVLMLGYCPGANTRTPRDGTSGTGQAPETSHATAGSSVPRVYTGPGSCSSVSCHGSVQPRADTRIAQNEYSIWVLQDKHAQAYTALSNPIATRMARLLGLGSPNQEPKCLACHALPSLPEQSGRILDVSDGVSCETCHGPASAWLGEHGTRGWTHERSLALGMYDTRDLVKRADLCLSCHLAGKDKYVDHEMIAAGHPDLYFELSSFSAAMPRHWKDPSGLDSAWEVHEWAVGQAVQLRDSLDHLAQGAQAATWPDFSVLDCFACHHSLTDAAHSWRQERGYSGRKPGTPPWDESRYAVFRIFMKEADSIAAHNLDERMAQLAREMNRPKPDRNAVASSCAEATRALEGTIQRLNELTYDNRLTVRLFDAVAGQADPLANAGERSAEQAAMALDTIYLSYKRQNPTLKNPALESAISGLFPLLENPGLYDQTKFAEQVRKVKSALN
jgi:hypothetical protein